MRLLNVTKLVTAYENIRKSQFPTSLFINVRGGLGARNYHWSVITLEREDSALRVMGLLLRGSAATSPGERPEKPGDDPKSLRISFSVEHKNDIFLNIRSLRIPADCKPSAL